MAPSGSVGLRQWALDQLAPLEAVAPWLVTESEKAEIKDRSRDALWLMLRVEVVALRPRTHLAERLPIAA